MARLQTGVERLLKAIRDGGGGMRDEMRFHPSSFIPHLSSLVLKQYDQWITRDLGEDLHRLRDVSTPTPIRLDDLPANLRERYVGKNGKWLVRVFSKDCLLNF